MNKTNQNKEITQSEHFPVEIYILDAPGINGMGPDCFERFKRHIENGGKVMHKARSDGNGIVLCEPNGMWPSQQAT